MTDKDPNPAQESERTQPHFPDTGRPDTDIVGNEKGDDTRHGTDEEHPGPDTQAQGSPESKPAGGSKHGADDAETVGV